MEAPAAMAAATTWRSSGSGRLTVGTRSSNPLIVAPGSVVRQPTGRPQALDGDGRRISRQVPNPFVVDLVGPARLDQTVCGSLDDDVPEMEGVEDAGVEDGNRRLKGDSAV